MWAEDARSDASDLPDVTSGIFLILGLDMISENRKLICPTDGASGNDLPAAGHWA
jgi:hypothetical protein